MHAIGALIHKHGNRRVRARVRNMLRHFLHDERGADKQADDSRCVLTRFFLHNCALIKLHKQVQSGLAQAFLDCAFIPAKDPASWLISRIQPYPMTDSGVYTSHYFIKWLVQAEALHLVFLIVCESTGVTAVVDVEIRLSARWRAVPQRRCSAPHYAERRHDSAPGSCRLSCLVSWQLPL